ncbi:MAG: class I SAM-dependent methyltransferase [Planctomycetaceae bacterium]
MASFYPADKYYAYHDNCSGKESPGRLRRWLKHLRDRAQCLGRSGLAAMVTRRFPNQDAADYRRWLKHTSVRSHRARILDIGCGDGWHLSRLHELGFTNLTGIDPYLPADMVSGPFPIHAAPLSHLFGQEYDFIMLHHSLEHMPDQVGVLSQVRRLLAPCGVCLVRLPIVSRGPWRMYGTNWVEIDAPRHFLLHSELSLKIAAEAAAFSIQHIQYESEPFSYAASELYRRNLSLYDSERKGHRDLSSVFSETELADFDCLSRSHLIPGWAGRAAFFLTPQSDFPLELSASTG